MEDARLEPVPPQADVVGELELCGLVHPVEVVEEHALIVPSQLDVVPERYISREVDAATAQEQTVSSESRDVLSPDGGPQFGGLAKIDQEAGDRSSIAARPWPCGGPLSRAAHERARRIDIRRKLDR